MHPSFSNTYRKSADENHTVESKPLTGSNSNNNNNINHDHHNNTSNSANGHTDDKRPNDVIKAMEDGDKYNNNNNTPVSLVKQIDSDDTELMTNTPQKRNWKGILLALLVIMFISSLILTASVLTTPKEKKIDHGLPFTFSDLMHVNTLLESFNSQTVNVDFESFVIIPLSESLLV
ncbi:unnamed protein product [Schistosoma turkestanicum]|nr:unnamed protein product [Schistosoma turkestanicum]